MKTLINWRCMFGFHVWGRWAYCGDFWCDSYEDRECLRCGKRKRRKIGPATRDYKTGTSLGAQEFTNKFGEDR